MKAKIAAVILVALLSCCTFASSESTTSLYGFDGNQGAVNVTYLQPNGDILIEASGFIETEPHPGQSIIRVAPDGEIIWAYHIPHMSEIGGTTLVELSDGRYMASAINMEDDEHIYFFDAEEGFLHVSEPIRGGWLYPMDGYILGVEGTGADWTRLKWINPEGEVEKYFDYGFPDNISNAYIAKSENGFIMLTTFDKGPDFTLTKINNDGIIEWQNSYAPPLDTVSFFMSDLLGGVFIINDPGIYADAFNVMHVDKDGNWQWDALLTQENANTHTMDVYEQGLRIQKGFDDTFQLGVIEYDGSVVWEATRTYPKDKYAGARYGIYNVLLGADGAEHVYGCISKKGNGEQYGLFFLPLDAFPFAEETANDDLPEEATAEFDVYDKTKMRTEIIAHIPNQEGNIDYAYNTVRLTTYYFGSFVARLPEEVSLDDIHTYHHVKVVLERPEKPFEDNYFSSDIEYVNAVSIESVDVMMGELLEQTDEYMDISIWTFERNSAREGEIQRFYFTEDSVFSRYVPIGDDVNVTYETDDDGNLIALLVTGFAG